ncbi:MAG: ABC transporter permease, partial [Aeromonas veronii]
MMPATTEILVDQPVATKQKVRRHWLPALVLLPFILLMILFQLAPMVWVLVGSFQTPDGWGI